MRGVLIFSSPALGEGPGQAPAPVGGNFSCLGDRDQPLGQACCGGVGRAVGRHTHLLSVVKNRIREPRLPSRRPSGQPIQTSQLGGPTYWILWQVGELDAAVGERDLDPV
jgi:hypothetical protein